MTMPNFLIIGAAKAGTTSLYYYLKQHPDIFMTSLKEPHFFAFEGENLNFRGPEQSIDPINTKAITDIDHYQKLFDDAGSEKRIGEASPSYLHTPKAAERIKHYIPEAKLIAILRNPTERAFSAFTGQYLNGIQKGKPYLKDFSEAIGLEEKFMAENWTPIFFFKKLGFYYEQLSHYYQLFPKKQIHVCLNEDLQKTPGKTLQKIFQYLDVNDDFLPDTSYRAGGSGIPKNKVVYRILKNDKLKSILKPIVPKGWGSKAEKVMLNKLKMPEDVRQNLIAMYREDIVKLQDLIDRDLSHWMN